MDAVTRRAPKAVSLFLCGFVATRNDSDTRTRRRGAPTDTFLHNVERQLKQFAIRLDGTTDRLPSPESHYG